MSVTESVPIRVCCHPDCSEATYGPKSPRCPAHRHENDRILRNARERRRGSRFHGSSARRVPSAERPFAFDAIKGALPEQKRLAERGINEPGWWGHLATAYSAMYPEVGFNNARQRVGRMRGQYIDAYTADNWAIALGLHPSEIWAEWHTAADLVDDDLMVVSGSGS